MPPRYAYWTIILEGAATAFRAHTPDELLPTLKQLQARHPDTVMKWFARGRLWDSPEQEHMAAALKKSTPRERRTDEWRPGGEHKDPRARFKIARDEKRRRFAANLRRERTVGPPPRDQKPAPPSADQPPRPPSTDRKPAGETPRADRPPVKRFERPRTPQRRTPGGAAPREGRAPGGKAPWKPAGAPRRPFSGGRPPRRDQRGGTGRGGGQGRGGGGGQGK